MAKYNFYRKKGNYNYKERTMLSEIAQRLTEKPELESSVTPASSFDELKSLHQTIMSDVAEILEDTITTPSASETIPPVEEPKEVKSPFIDPLNREEPNVRDYVMEDQFDPFADFNRQTKHKSEFREPTNFDDAFNVPDEEEMRNAGKEQIRGGQQKQQQSRPQPQRQSNDGGSDWGGSSGVNKRKSKRFATSIVNVTCRLLEVGFVWYATKDINEQKLAEYEMTGEIDLSLIVELPSGQEATIKDFFLNQLGDIQEASKINPESKAELIEALTELFVEKNIQPSATYDVLLSGVSIVAEQGIKLMMIVQQNNAILNQLRDRGRTQDVPYQEPEPTPPPRSQPQPQRQGYTNPEPTPFDPDWESKEIMKAERDYRQSQKMADQYFGAEPNEQIIAQADQNILDDDIDLDDEIENDLSLLDGIETKE